MRNQSGAGPFPTPPRSTSIPAAQCRCTIDQLGPITDPSSPAASSPGIFRRSSRAGARRGASASFGPMTRISRAGRGSGRRDHSSTGSARSPRSGSLAVCAAPDPRCARCRGTPRPGAVRRAQTLRLRLPTPETFQQSLFGVPELKTPHVPYARITGIRFQGSIPHSGYSQPLWGSPGSRCGAGIIRLSESGMARRGVPPEIAEAGPCDVEVIRVVPRGPCRGLGCCEDDGMPRVNVRVLSMRLQMPQAVRSRIARLQA